MRKNLKIKQLLFIFLALTVLSCKDTVKDKSQDKTQDKSQDKISKTFDSDDTSQTKYAAKQTQSNSKNKVEVNFVKNKDLLDIIVVLPDSVFSSWGWKLEDRIKWYNEIKTNNYYTDDSPDYFTQKYFEPTKAGFLIVDGFWSINLYKTSENTYIVITNDIVGDGNALNFYEVNADNIKEYLNEKMIFSDFKELLKRKDSNEKCNEKYEELNDPIFSYDFSKKNQIEIECSWHLTKQNYSDCFVGNSILYNFNPDTKKFELEKIYWKAKQKN